MSGIDNYKVDSLAHGYHVYRDIGETDVGQTLLRQWETGNLHDPYAVSVMEGSTVVGHFHEQYLLLQLVYGKKWYHLMQSTWNKAKII